MRRSLLAAGACCALSAALAWAADREQLEAELRLDKGNNLADLRTGEQTFKATKFKIEEGLIQLGSSFLPKMPKRVVGIKVDRTFW